LSELPPFCQFSSSTRHIIPSQNPVQQNCGPRLPQQHHQAEPHPRFHEYTHTACHHISKRFGLRGWPPKLLPTTPWHHLRCHTIQRTSLWRTCCIVTQPHELSAPPSKPLEPRSLQHVCGVHPCYLAADTGTQAERTVLHGHPWESCRCAVTTTRSTPVSMFHTYPLIFTAPRTTMA
jgi:hypothetical protein